MKTVCQQEVKTSIPLEVYLPDSLEKFTLILDRELMDRVEIELLRKGKRRYTSALVRHLLESWLAAGAPVDNIPERPRRAAK